MNFFYFQTAADDAAAFPVANLYAIDAAATAVTLYFTGATSGTGSAGMGGLLSTVALTVTAGQEEAVVKAVAAAANSANKGLGAPIVIADDANSVYIDGGIELCGTITMDVNPAT